MRRNVKIAKLFSIVVMLGILFGVVFYKLTDQTIIKASEQLMPQDFQLSSTVNWNNEKKNSSIDLEWKDFGDVKNATYKLYRSENGEKWDDFSLDKIHVEEIHESESSDTPSARSKKNKVSQVVMKSEFQDETIIDDVPPETPTVTVSNTKDNSFKLELFSKDRGKEYQWYVEAKDESNRIQKSDIITEEVASGLRGFVYFVDNSATTIPTIERNDSGAVTNLDIEVEPYEDTAIIPEINGEENNWAHIVAIDQSNNVSDVKHVELKKESRAIDLRDENRFVNFQIERTADTAKFVDVLLGSSIDRKMKSLEIKIPKNVEIKDYNNLTLPSSWYKFQNSDGTDYQSFTFAMNNTNDSNTIKKFLEGLRFNILTPTDQKGNIQIVFHELVYTSWEDSTNKKHYYTFIPTQRTWLQAYNLAKKMRYRGLTGYLATLTSLEEHNFVYTNIAKQSGWLGGARFVKSNRQKINDEASISERISDYNITTSVAREWYWVNGPEKGLVFLNRPTYAGGGRAPAGVYQGFNNRAAGGTGAEPNNAGGSEYVLEFAQASAGSPTKLWNDLEYNRTTYNTGYYVEFSEYGDQVEKEEETDVSASSEIPQKIILKAFDEENNALTSGDLLFDQELRIDKTESVTPKEIDFYDFIKLSDDKDNQLSSLEYTVTNNKQTGKLVYNSRKLTIHVRQVVVNKNKQTVFPKKGFGLLESSSKTEIKKDTFPLTMVSTEDNEETFDTFIIRYQIDEPIYAFTSQVPMNYSLLGYVLTTNDKKHQQSDSTKTPVQIDVETNPEFWLTTYITPNTEEPSFYHWNYKENKLGQIKLLE